MANTPSSKLPQRIIELDPIPDADIETVLYPTESAGQWYTAIDYKTDENSPINPATGDPIDYGTKRIPMSRIVLRDENGLIPPSMLPEHVDDVVYGKFEPKNTDHPNCARFITEEPFVPGPDDPDPGPGVTYIYEYPLRSDPPANVKQAEEHLVYMDTTGSSNPSAADYNPYYHMQFIFHTPAAGATLDEFCGFTTLPSTKIIKSAYGIEVNDLALTTDISVKKPEVVTGNITHTMFEGANGSGSSPVVTAVIPYMRKGVTYMITVNLAIHPHNDSMLTPMIEDFVITFSTTGTPVVTKTMTFEVDMSTSSTQYFTKSTLITLPDTADGLSYYEQMPTLPDGIKVEVIAAASKIEFVEVL